MFRPLLVFLHTTQMTHLKKRVSCLIQIRFLHVFVYLITSPKIFGWTSNIKNVLFFTTWQYYAVFKPNTSVLFHLQQTSLANAVSTEGSQVTYRLPLLGNTQNRLGTAGLQGPVVLTGFGFDNATSRTP